MKNLLLLLTIFTVQLSNAQSIILNEVSNGPNGSKEYMEFVVMDVTATYNCGLTTPPCIDIRGWIFDDNIGYHGSEGVAGGALRFSFDDRWSCVPVGTIILVYNNLAAEFNPLIPVLDTSLEMEIVT